MIEDTQLLLELYETTINVEKIALSSLVFGINDFEEFIIITSTDGVEAVYDKTCDHAGGKLRCENEGSYKCPLHGWKFNPKKGSYNNGSTKKPIEYVIKDGNLLIKRSKKSLRFPGSLVQSLQKSSVKVRFVAHACVLIEVEGCSILLDPWLFGPAFSLGWWHLYPPKSDVYDLLTKVDLVYLSHNHSDHMHLESLKHINPNAKYIVPNFDSGSAYTSAVDFGLSDLEALKFNQVYKVGSHILLSLLNSGDFRDDSGLYINVAGQEFLFSVDSNMLNSMVLPEKLDFLFASFSSGASGYPWCWDIYEESKKAKIANKSKAAAVIQLSKYIDVTNPKVYIPYAGFFSPLSADDQYIRDNLRHNSPDEIIQKLGPKFQTVEFINPLVSDTVLIDSEGRLEKFDMKLPRAYSVDNNYIAGYKSSLYDEYQDFEIDEILPYFRRQSFEDDLILLIELCDWDFKSLNQCAIVNFSDKSVNIYQVKDQLNSCWDADSEFKKLWIKTRTLPFAKVVRESLSWEELSIGFQCHFLRKPDVYNTHFWHYFSNEVC